MTCKFQSIKSHFHAPLKHTTTWLSRKHLLTLSRSETPWITDNLKSFLKYNPEQWNGTIPNLYVPCTIQCSNMHLYIPITQSWNVFHKLICKIISYKLFKKNHKQNKCFGVKYIIKQPIFTITVQNSGTCISYMGDFHKPGTKQVVLLPTATVLQYNCGLITFTKILTSNSFNIIFK